MGVKGKGLPGELTYCCAMFFTAQEVFVEGDSYLGARRIENRACQGC